MCMHCMCVCMCVHAHVHRYRQRHAQTPKVIHADSLCVCICMWERESECVGENWLSFVTVSVCPNGNFYFPLKQCCQSEIIKQGCDGNVEWVKLLLCAGHDSVT